MQLCLSSYLQHHIFNHNPTSYSRRTTSQPWQLFLIIFNTRTCLFWTSLFYTYSFHTCLFHTYLFHQFHNADVNATAVNCSFQNRWVENVQGRSERWSFITWLIFILKLTITKLLFRGITLLLSIICWSTTGFSIHKILYCTLKCFWPI